MNCGQGKRQKLLPNKRSRNVTSSLYSLVLLWYIYTVEYYSAIKKKEIMPFAVTWRDLESVILSEVSQMEKEKYRMTSLICGIEKEMIQMSLLKKQKNQTMVARGRGKMGDGVVRELWIDIYTLLYLKQITNKDLLYSTGNSAQCHVAAGMGGEFGKNGYMYMCD